MKKKMMQFVAPMVLAALTFLMIVTEPLMSFDNEITDRLYSQFRQTSRDIVIVAIDEKTLDTYGSFSTWSRSKTAEVIEKLYADPNNTPAVVGVDITFQGETTPENDAKLAQATQGDKDVVVSGALVFKGQAEKNADGKMVYNSLNIGMIEYPYDALRENVTTGYANAFLGKDSVDRYYMTETEYDGQIIPSFSYACASIYANRKGTEVVKPAADKGGLFRFFYAGKGGEFQHISMATYLENDIPASEFKDKIVLIGAYASGMQDSYQGTADTEGYIYGVEIQANVIQAFLDGATAVSVNKTIHAVIMAVLLLGVFLLLGKAKMVFAIIVPILIGAAHLFVGKILSGKGLLISQIYVLIVLALMIVYFVVNKYVAEAMKRRHVMKVFGKYMEPRLVAQMAKEGSVESSLGGQKRDVSVLFVDIRGFTSMSEVLEPEQVVEILNKYLGHVTNCIFKHHGMLDKFIGDAAMAVFNAPADQEDYYYESVAAAWDIANGAKDIQQELQDKYGRSVSFGVGVNCGPAVVGNIGCDFRMDYTAIGDTVNTSARLEANAGRGEILISDKLNEILAGRIVTESAGPMQFKGKAEPMEVYRVVGLIG